MNQKPFLKLGAAACASLVLSLGAVGTAAVEPSLLERLKEYRNHRCESKQELGSVALAAGGQARFVIVAPEGAPAPVRFAAEELKHYLDRITGGDFKIVAMRPAGQPAIVLGNGPETRAAGIDVGAIARDGYAIIARANTILIAGKDDATAKSDILFDLRNGPFSKEVFSQSQTYPYLGDAVWDFERGTLYGAYRFLEELGVRWFFPGPKGEVVPANRGLSVRAFTARDEPAFALRNPHPMNFARGNLYRYGIAQGAEVELEEFEDIEWTGRANRHWYLRMRGSSEWFAFNHHPASHYWDQRFATTHPEYFGMKPDGKRDIKANQTSRFYGHLCYSEEGVFRETMKDIEAFFTGQPAASRGLPEGWPMNRGWPPNASYGSTFSLLPHDEWQGCHCERCKAKTHKDGGELSKLSGIFWPFAERIARETEKRCPGKVLTCLAYADFAEIPEGVRLPDNVLVGCSPQFLQKTFNIVNPESYQELMELVERLDAANGMPLFYWFHHLFKWRGPQHYGAPMLLPHFMARFIGDLSKHGRLFFLETDYHCMMQEYLTRYVFMRATYDPTIDVDALVRDHAQTYYGPAAGIIEPMLLDIEKRSERMAAASPRNNNNGVNAVEIWWDYFPGDVVSGYRESADRALRLAKGGPYEEHVRLFSKYFIGLMEKGYGRYKYPVRPGGVAFKKDCPLPPSLAPLKDRVVAVNAEEFVYSPDVARSHAKLVHEPASATGRAARVLIEEIQDPRRENYYLTDKRPFAFHVYDRESKKILSRASFKAVAVPDAGYNLYALKDVTFPADASLILFWSGHLQVRLHSRVKPGETCNIYVSARFDGPGFPHGNPDTQDAIYIDRVFLLRKERQSTGAPE